MRNAATLHNLGCSGPLVVLHSSGMEKPVERETTNDGNLSAISSTLVDEMQYLSRWRDDSLDPEARALGVYLAALSAVGILVSIAYAVSGAWTFLLVGLPGTGSFILGTYLVTRGELARAVDFGIVLSSVVLLGLLVFVYIAFPADVDAGATLIATSMYLMASTGFFARRHYQPVIVGITGTLVVAVKFFILAQPEGLLVRDAIVLTTVVFTAAGSVFVFDLSHNLRRTRKRIQHVNEELTEAMEVKERFLANMSHEIRTPLSGVIGSANLPLQESPRSDQIETIQGLVKSGQSLLSIVDDLLNISKIDAGGYEFENEAMSIGELLADVESLYGVSAKQKGLTLSVQVAEEVPDIILSDRERLKQILGNLVSNAVKYTEGGSVVVTVAAGAPRELRISVQDTGIGIPPEDQPRLFQLFEQLDSSYAKRYYGTGLGLAITKRLVESAGGSIDLESEPGVGTTFVVTLPVAVPDTADVDFGADTPTTRNAPASPRRPPSGEIRILLAEDEFVNARIMVKQLESRGATVIHVRDGSEVLERLPQVVPDLIVMDAQMPGMSGVEATERIRSSDGPFRDIPIVGVTAYSHQADIDQLLAAGMNECYTKPLESSQLDELLERYLPESG